MSASLAEWSKAADLSSAIERCVSSNLTARICISWLFFSFWVFAVSEFCQGSSHLLNMEVNGVKLMYLTMGFGPSSGLGQIHNFMFITIDIIS